MPPLSVRGHHTGAISTYLREVSVVLGRLFVRSQLDLFCSVFDRKHRLLRQAPVSVSRNGHVEET